jgi:hypothetical protein
VASRIGELLVQDGACTPEALREALRNQVIFGGRVGTNLLELKAVDEEALARALGRLHRCPWVAGTALEPEPEAVRAVPAEVADRCEVVPLQLADRHITVAACDPSNLSILDEVAFVTGKTVRAVVAPEARIWALLRSEYGLIRELRGLDFEAESLAGPTAPPPPAPELRQGTLTDLMDQTEFDHLYGRKLPGAVPPPDDEIIDLTDEMVEPAPAPRAAPPVAPPPVAPPPVHVPPPEPEAAPLQFDEAMVALAGVTDRAAIARIVLRYARTRLRRAVLLTVHRDAALGWEGMGEGLPAEKVRAIRLRLGVPGVLDTVVRTQAHYLGPLPRMEANVRLLKVLGGGVPKNALLVPILALGRVVNVIYADGGRGAMVDAGGVGELLILATRIAQSYAAMVARV